MPTPAVGDPILLETAPGREVARTGRTAATGGTFTAETLLDSVTASLINGHTYRVTCRTPVQSSVANDRVLVRIRENNLVGAQSAFHLITLPDTTLSIPGLIEVFFIASSTGSKTFVTTAARSSGTGNITAPAGSTNPAFLEVQYVEGP